jgi:hypothetical protein
VELSGGKQTGLDIQFSGQFSGQSSGISTPQTRAQKAADTSVLREPRSFPLSDEEEAAHAAAIAGIKDNLWNKRTG